MSEISAGTQALIDNLTAENAELKDYQVTLLQSIKRHVSENAALKERVRGLEAALKTIASYDWNSENKGCCPYGCDTPAIAQAALED